MNIVSSVCSGLEWLRMAMCDAGAQGLGLDANHDEIRIPEGSFCLLQAPASVRAATDVARAILDGDLVAMYHNSNANEGLPPLAALEYPRAGALLMALHKVSKIEGTNHSVHPVMRNILSFLEPKDVANATSNLPSGWGSYQIDDLLLRTDFPLTDASFRVIDQKVWVECFGERALKAQGLSFGEAPRIQSINDLRARVRSFNELASIPVENNAGFTLMTLPDGELTLNKLIALAKAPQAGHQPAGISYIYGPIASQYGDLPVKGGFMAISNGVLACTRKKSVAEQSALVAGHGCQMPRLLDAVALCFLTYVNSSSKSTGAPERLLSDAPWTYTRCIDQIAENGRSYNLVVGGFARAGLDVSSDRLVNDYDGVCVLRKF